MSVPAFRVAPGTPDPRRQMRAEQSNHFVGQALALASRIRDHIERLDGGAPYAVDDLAVTLRAMLATGRGNDVLGRLANLSSRRYEVQLSRPPVLDSLFSVGSIPVRGSNAGQYGAAWVPLERWAHTHVLRVTSDSQGTKNYRWGTFLDAYANKWGGAHLDRDVPMHLMIIDKYEAGGHLLSAYLLRSAAVQVWYLAQALLKEVLQDHLPSEAKSVSTLSAWISAEGGIGEPPATQRERGELQFINYTGDVTEVVAFYDPTSTPLVRIGAGASLSYDLQIVPDGVEPAPQSTLRARTFQPPGEVVVSNGRTMKVRGSFQPFDLIDPDGGTEEAASAAKAQEVYRQTSMKWPPDASEATPVQ